MNWIRWKYVVPRVVALVVLCLVLEYGSGSAIRYALVHSGEKSLGAKVEIHKVTASLLSGDISIHNVVVAHPQKPLTNLLEADLIELNMSSQAFLYRRAVVEKGRILGLKLGTPRQESGILQTAQTPASEEAINWDWMTEPTTAAAKQWLDRLGDQFEQDLHEQFVSVRLAEELAARWPAKYTDLEAEIRAFKQRAKKLETEIKLARDNPLRYVDFLQNMPTEIQSLTAELARLQQTIRELPGLVEKDRLAILAAKKEDERRIRENLTLETIDAETLTEYLLQEKVSGQLGEVIAWVRWVRKLVPTKPKAETTPLRGKNVSFAGVIPLTNMLVKSLSIQGSARISGQPVEMTGMLTDFTNEPRLHGTPTKLHLVTTGSLPTILDALIDRTGDIPQDRITMTCAGIVVPKLSLGKKGKLALNVQPSIAGAVVDIQLEGEQIRGSIRFTQHNVRITSDVSKELAKLGLGNRIATSLRSLTTLETTVLLSGTLDKPRYKLASNLGPAMANSFDKAIKGAVEEHTRRLLNQSDQQVNEKMASIQQLMQDKSNLLGAELTKGGDLLGVLSKGPLRAKLPFSWKQIGRLVKPGATRK